ncbi:MAG: N-acetylglucosamine-6-sulfatase [Thermoleophilaceae bacterium]|jgi:arylsulfatase A-like enzyme|nr:N-acetylglucosamine-6-sulfatase [Thermoleophilaceae bacterium]
MSRISQKLPSRRALVAGSVLALLLGGLVAVGINREAATASTSATKPNIIFIQTDDQTLCSIIKASFCAKQYKQVMPKTRQLMIDQGTTFSNYFQTHPRCCPSRATALTGMYSHNHGLLSNKHGYGRFAFQNVALPVWLKNAGYHTAHIGKYMNGYFGRFADDLPVPPGWDEWYATVDNGTYHMFNYDMLVKSPAPIRNLNGVELVPPVADPHRVAFGNLDSDYQTDIESSIADDYITREATDPDPFYLAINPLAPHTEHLGKSNDRAVNPRPAPRDKGRFRGAPLPKGPSFDEKDVKDKPGDIQKKPRLSSADQKFIQNRYRSQIESLLAVDDLVQRLFTTLTDTGQLANTVIIYVSDNGFMAGEHRLASGKVALYDESVRGPLIMRGPGIPTNAIRTQLSGNIDIAPTIADIAGATPLTTVDGISLLDYLSNPSLDNGRAMLLENGVDGARAIRDGRYTYIDDDSGKELYDNVKDPHELESRDSDKAYSGIVRDLKKRLKPLETCAGSNCQE